tara:strand:- start:365 stop:562 length:198 start_codon:yes stop_codon:yes gene_type:complete
METVQVTEVINNIGFPIFMVLVLLWFIKKYMEKFLDVTSSFKESLVDNTNAIEKLSDLIGNQKNV